MAKGKIVITGYKEILQDIENIERKAPAVLSKALEETAKETDDNYRAFISKHHYAGITEDSLELHHKIINEGDKLSVQTGFSLDKGGIASIYLDKGTPRMKPYNYLKSVRNKKIMDRIFSEKLKEIL